MLALVWQAKKRRIHWSNVPDEKRVDFVWRLKKLYVRSLISVSQQYFFSHNKPAPVGLLSAQKSTSERALCPVDLSEQERS